MTCGAYSKNVSEKEPYGTRPFWKKISPDIKKSTIPAGGQVEPTHIEGSRLE